MATIMQNPTMDVDYASIPTMSEDVFTAPLQRPAHVGEDWLEKQSTYDSEDDAIWNDLYARQMELLPGRACTAFMRGLDKLNLDRGGVPDFGEISEELKQQTGWSVVAVPALVPDHVFFYHLANRRFPAGNFIRTRETIDYLPEPDIFHDIFGHVPLHADPVFADYMEAYGKAGWRAMQYNRLKALGALYWYTVEFGLILEEGDLRAYGAGILSGPTEVRFSVEAKSPNRIMLDVDRVMRTDYVISDLQNTYFVIESFEDLFHKTEGRDFAKLYERLPMHFTYATTAVIDTDDVIQLGTQEYALRGGRGSSARPV